MFFNKFCRFTGIFVAVITISGATYAANLAMVDKKGSKETAEKSSYFIVRDPSNTRFIAIASKSKTGEMSPLTIVNAGATRTMANNTSAQIANVSDENVADEKKTVFKMMDVEKIEELVKLGTSDLLEGNAKRAQSCFEAAAEKGGFDVSLCYQRAVKIFNSLVQEKNVEAYRAFAWCLENGKGTTKSICRAILYYKLAAICGDRTSIMRLAELYREGSEGVAVNSTEAHRYGVMAHATQVLAEQRERVNAHSNVRVAKELIKQ